MLLSTLYPQQNIKKYNNFIISKKYYSTSENDYV